VVGRSITVTTNTPILADDLSSLKSTHFFHADGGLVVIRAILKARERPEAERHRHVKKECQEKVPRLAEWQEVNGPESPASGRFAWRRAIP
jgi:hypothetical protein